MLISLGCAATALAQPLLAPVEVAARFSFESPTPEAPALDGQFGTHVFTKRSQTK